MIHKKNIGDTDVIINVAEELKEQGILNLTNFETSLYSSESANLFREDLERIKIKGITRYPTILITYKKKTFQITGYRPFSVLLDTFKYLDPSLEINEAIDRKDYMASWQNITNRELEEISEGQN